VRRLLVAALHALDEQARVLDVALRVETAPDVPEELPIDANKVGWAVATLVGNALRYVRRGTRRLPGGTIVVRTQYAADVGELGISVEDDGAGIPEDTLAKLFEGGATALMLIKDVVEAHGGSVRARSSTHGLDSGTEITLRIPARSST
jgi:signal transduction histidine kinase